MTAPAPIQSEMIRVATAHGSVRSFSQKTVAVFAIHLNECLKDDHKLNYLLPINPDNLDLMNKVADGVLIARFINFIHPDTIDFDSVNYKEDGGLSQYHIIENHNRNLAAAKQLGARIQNVSAEDLRDAVQNPILVLGLMCQLVTLQFLSKGTVAADPELIAMVKDTEVDQVAYDQNTASNEEVESADFDCNETEKEVVEPMVTEEANPIIPEMPVSEPEEKQEAIVSVLSSSSSPRRQSVTMFDVWKQQRRDELEEKAQKERDEINKVREKGTAKLKTFHEERRQRIETQEKAVRDEEVNQKQSMNEVLQRGGIWQQAARMVDLKNVNPATSRMRDLMLILKNEEEAARSGRS